MPDRLEGIRRITAFWQRADKEPLPYPTLDDELRAVLVGHLRYLLRRLEAAEALLAVSEPNGGPIEVDKALFRAWQKAKGGTP